MWRLWLFPWELKGEFGDGFVENGLEPGGWWLRLGREGWNWGRDVGVERKNAGPLG